MCYRLELFISNIITPLDFIAPSQTGKQTHVIRVEKDGFAFLRYVAD